MFLAAPACEAPHGCPEYSLQTDVRDRKGRIGVGNLHIACEPLLRESLLCTRLLDFFQRSTAFLVQTAQ